jgi:hypothetical protein
MAIKTFSSGEVLTAANTNEYLANSGLVFVKSQTVGSAVASVTITSAFSSTYDNYRIVISGGAFSTGTHLFLKLGTTATNGHYGTFVFSNYLTNIVQSLSDDNTAQFSFAGGGGTDNTGAVIDLMSPNLPKTTRISATHIHYIQNFGTYNGVEVSSSQHTSFIIAPSTGTINGSTITVYGYRKG